METSLPGTETLAGGRGVGLLAPQWGSAQPRYPSQILFGVYEVWTSPAYDSTPPTSLHVASSLHLCCGTSVKLRFQVVLNDGCSVVQL